MNGDPAVPQRGACPAQLTVRARRDLPAPTRPQRSERVVLTGRRLEGGAAPLEVRVREPNRPLCSSCSRRIKVQLAGPEAPDPAPVCFTSSSSVLLAHRLFGCVAPCWRKKATAPSAAFKSFDDKHHQSFHRRRSLGAFLGSSWKPESSTAAEVRTLSTRNWMDGAQPTQPQSHVPSSNNA